MDLTPGRWTPELVVLPFHLNFKKKKNYVFLAVLGLCCCSGIFSSCDKWGYSIVVASGLHVVTASRGRPRALGTQSSVVAVPGL